MKNSHLAKSERNQQIRKLLVSGKSQAEVARDWRLLPAIAVRESSGGKQTCGNNPFGWASCRAGFESVEKAIEIVGVNLCGLNSKTASYYSDKTTLQKLQSYNGSINPNYPAEVFSIMEKF